MKPKLTGVNVLGDAVKNSGMTTFVEQARLELEAMEGHFGKAVLWLVWSAARWSSCQTEADERTDVAPQDPERQAKFPCYLTDSHGRLITENGRFVRLNPWTGERE